MTAAGGAARRVWDDWTDTVVQTVDTDSPAAAAHRKHTDALNYTVSQRNDTDVAHYNFDTDQPILIIFGRNVAETVCYQTLICYLTSPN